MNKTFLISSDVDNFFSIVVYLSYYLILFFMGFIPPFPLALSFFHRFFFFFRGSWNPVSGHGLRFLCKPSSCSEQTNELVKPCLRKQPRVRYGKCAALHSLHSTSPKETKVTKLRFAWNSLGPCVNTRTEHSKFLFWWSIFEAKVVKYRWQSFLKVTFKDES